MIKYACLHGIPLIMVIPCVGLYSNTENPNVWRVTTLLNTLLGSFDISNSWCNFESTFMKTRMLVVMV